MLLILNKASGHVPLKILSIEDGTVLKSFNHPLHRNKKVDFIEQFNEKLLVKQENENLQILDVRVVFVNLLSVLEVFILVPPWYLTGDLAGSQLWVDRSQQDRVYDTVGFHISVREPVVSDIQKPNCGCLELPRRARNFFRGPPFVAPWLQHQQHLHHKRSRPHHFLLQGRFRWSIIRRKW